MVASDSGLVMTARSSAATNPLRRSLVSSVGSPRLSQLAPRSPKIYLHCDRPYPQRRWSQPSTTQNILSIHWGNAQEIYAVVDKLSRRFTNIYLIITSRISTVPPHCEALEIPMLSTGSVCVAFHRIHQGEQSNSINNILEQLDFRPLSVTLLATVAQYNEWDTSRLAEEWEMQRTGVLRAQHSGAF